jgi:hypothetical protein
MTLCDSCNKFDAGCPWSRETPVSISVCCEHSPITRAQLSTAQAELAAVRKAMEQINEKETENGK